MAKSIAGKVEESKINWSKIKRFWLSINQTFLDRGELSINRTVAETLLRAISDYIFKLKSPW